jgi:hypothetical protein
MGNVRRRFQRWANLHNEYLSVEMQADGTLIPDAPEMPMDDLAWASIYVGEAVYSLRSALDYLVYTLAMVKTPRGQLPSGSQFPIDDDMNVFDGRVTGRNPKTKKAVRPFLRNVPEVAVERIRQLQPCYTPPCEWTRMLRELSNPDKHERLTPLRSKAVFQIDPTAPIVRKGKVATVQARVEVEVFLIDLDLLDAFDTLEFLQRQVAALIEEFIACF